MTNEEIKFQCLRVACEVLGVYQGSVAYRNDVGNAVMPMVDEVLEKAKQIFNWVTE